MTESSNKIVSLEAYRCSAAGKGDLHDAEVRYGTSENPDVIEVQGMRFSDVGKWIVEQTKIRETMMVQARVRFTGAGTGRVDLITLDVHPNPALFEAMPFEVSSARECSAMLNAYDYMVGEDRYPAETIVAGFTDGWVALESAAESHGCVPPEAYEASASWPV